MPTWPPERGDIGSIPPGHIGLLHDTLRAPSAHNAQPWLIRPAGDGMGYEVHYDQAPDLPEDHDDKDAYLTMGAFIETMVLQAPNHGYNAAVEPVLATKGRDLFIAKVALEPAQEGQQVDPLSAWIDKRVTNRNPYKKQPLPDTLEKKLKSLGNVLVAPELLQSIVLGASMRGWASSRYVSDLKRWFHKDPTAPDGLTASALRLGKLGTLALEFAFKRGSLKSKAMGWAYSSSEVAMFASAPKVAVLTAKDTTPEALFDAGRRLLRSWVEITAEGYASQPYSIAVDDRQAASEIAHITGAEIPVALYRIGKPTQPPAMASNRKPLAEVII